MNLSRPAFPSRRLFAWALPLALVGVSATRIPWEDLTEGDWLYPLATRVAAVDGHRVHYPTPPAELAKLLEGHREKAALRHLAEARLSLGDRAGALAAMERWAAAEGPAAWAETARWAWAHHDPSAAFKAAEKALPGLPMEAKRALADDRVRWADLMPEMGDPIALRKARAATFPEDAGALEDWLRALERAGRLPEADQALAAAPVLSPERRLLLRSDLAADHGDHKAALQVLDQAVAEPWSPAFRSAFAQRVDRISPGSPGAWRTILEARWDPAALVRLASYFQGRQRGDAALGLVRQLERRHEAAFTRQDHLLVARLYGEVDAIPEAFRATLAAAHLGSAEDQKGDLAALAHLALRAGSRPLALGTNNDESYHWVAAVDRTPGFWTGGLSFLLTGLEWKEALERLESESLADRTFASARALANELARRSPQHPGLPALRVALMERHVARGEGRAALALLPLVEGAAPALADEARRFALLAARQVSVPLGEEVRWMKARLRHAAADGSRPVLGDPGSRPVEEGAEAFPEPEEGASEGEDEPRPDRRPEFRASQPWRRIPAAAPKAGYGEVLEDSLGRLEAVDRSHRSSLGLMLGEMDRLPDAESLWLNLSSRLEGWSLDDDLGPRYERALSRFQGTTIWDKCARWYARRERHADLKRLAETLAATFRGAAIFQRGMASDIRVEIPEQPPVGGRVRLVAWADWVRLKALERFPHSQAVFQEAQRLVTQSDWQKGDKHPEAWSQPVVVPDALMAERYWALLFVDGAKRESFFSEAMRKGTLEAKLAALEQAERTPVADLLLFEGWARLSRFERAVDAADRVAAAYPGDGALAQRVLSLHRSLNGLETSHGARAYALVKRTAPALEDAAPLWTELGEMEEDRGNPAAAMAVWKAIQEREPRNPARIAELSTLLWDYNHDAEALAVVEAGRKRLGRPRFFAFETGVLRENLKDLPGAVREYLEAVRPEQGDGFASWFEQDQRSLRRLAQLLSRDRVYRLVEQRIQALQPGVTEDERALAAFFPLGALEPPTPGLSWDADTWIDAMDLPNDPKGRELRQDQKAKDRPREYDAIHRIGDLLLEKTRAMVPKATALGFLEAAEGWSGQLLEARWPKARVVAFRNAAMARRAELAPTEESRIRQEMARADYLVQQDRLQEADAVWAALAPRIGTLPEGATRLRAEAARAGYLERAKGAAAASAEWRRLTTRYAWSLGLLEDRLAFLDRTGKGDEGRALLEEVVPKAASGHREALLERLTRECLAAGDLPRARRATARLLAEEGLDDAHRMGAIHLLARLSLKEDPAWDPFTLVKSEGPKFKPEDQAELYHQLASAADLERAYPPAMGLWIEALNRRTEREWLQAACRTASKAGKGAEFLGFFEKQHQRSPRDVRWAVAVRDIRRAFHQVEGALEAAKAAVAVRPDKEQYWREAADLLVRADRIREAADYLEGWNRPRPADESVARWRGELYARVHEGDKVLALERAALKAYAEENPGQDDELAERKGRAADRLLSYGYPALALKLYSAKGEIGALAGSKLSLSRQCEIALLVGQATRLLSQRAHEPEVLTAMGGVLHRQGRPEHHEEVLAFVLGQVYPGTPDASALDHWWPLVAQAGLEAALRRAAAARYLLAHPGPWQGQVPEPFLDAVGEEHVSTATTPTGGTARVFREPQVWGLWARDLTRRDRCEELTAFMEPRWQELRAAVHGRQPLNDKSSLLPWATWLQGEGIGAWARGAAARPEKIRELGELMGDRRAWDRFWVLAARAWDTRPLLALLPEAQRLAWFRFWERPGTLEDPLQLARQATVEGATTALGRLLKGDPGAAEAPLVAKLRGPQTVGEILGKNSLWVWQEFTPRRNAHGDLLETGDDRITGQGAEAGRLPGALWGERPGEAWYVLETLVRFRKGDATAPLVPLDVPQRGAETDRALLALRLARAQKNLPLALELEASHAGRTQDRRWMESRVAILLAAGQKEKAVGHFRAYLRHAQAKLTEGEFRSLAAFAEEAGLPAPMDLLDAERPVGPVFLAYLWDLGGPGATSHHTADPVGFRSALASRWSQREGELSADQVRIWLRELWVHDAAGLPGQAFAKLGGNWPHARAWLSRQPAPERAAALDALDLAMNPAVAQPPLLPRLAQEKGDDIPGLLALRLRLARHEQAQAMALLDDVLDELRRGQEPAYFAPSWDRGEAAPEEAEGEEAPPAPRPDDNATSDPGVNRLELWLKPFREAKASADAEARIRAYLQERRAQGAVSTPAWRLAFRLGLPEDRPRLAQELEAAWFRGEVEAHQLGSLSETLAAVLPAEAPRWLARWPRTLDWNHTRSRGAVLLKLKDPAAAARLCFDARRRTLWAASEEVQAFDAWRQAGGAATPEDRAPAAWTAALAFWKARADAPLQPLGEHLKAHPFDVLSARTALRSPAPAPESAALRALSVLQQARGYSRRGNDLFLRLRAARALLPGSWRAARTALGPGGPEHWLQLLRERRHRTPDINAALADLARLSSRAGDDQQARAYASLLAERKAPGLAALRTELALDRPAKSEGYHLVNGRPTPIRPRDLTWAMVDDLLKAEGVR